VRWDVPKEISGFSFLTESRFSYDDVSDGLRERERRDWSDGTGGTWAKNM